MSKKDKPSFPLETLRHSFSHILAQAVVDMFPDAKLGIGPDIEDGFYYDFELPRTLIPEDLPLLEKKMKHIIKQAQEFKKFSEPVDKSIEFLKKIKQDYKVELAKDLRKEGEKEISFYENGPFVDMCRGPHVERTSQLPADAFKLHRIAGAYWRGDEKNPMLQRIYGFAFETKAKLDEHLNLIEEAKKRDHRRIGKDLDLFSLHEEAGAGLVYWHPKGARVRSIIEDFCRQEHYKNGYEYVYTPHVGKSWLWETSGHLGFYKDSMYSPMQIDEEDYYAKPMNCPFHIMIYNNSTHSYRELPYRWAEFGTVYRYEASGVLHGLLRVRGFTQDDAHIICTPEQIEDEIYEVLRFSLSIWDAFGFKDIKAYLATRPKKAIGEEKQWKQAGKSLLKAIEKMGIDYEVDEEGGAFYGPKIDLKIKDAIGREWQMTTIQFDFNLPERFDMKYVGEDGKDHRPFMVHRALLGSMERFFGVLIEHYAGAFPVWLAPVQVDILPVAESHEAYAKKVLEELKKNLIRAEYVSHAETLGKRIRNSEMRKVPYMLVIGDKEMGADKLNVRSYKDKSQKEYSVSAFVKKVLKEVAERTL